MSFLDNGWFQLGMVWFVLIVFVVMLWPKRGEGEE